jgi:hypothetical protein
MIDIPEVVDAELQDAQKGAGCAFAEDHAGLAALFGLTTQRDAYLPARPRFARAGMSSKGRPRAGLGFGNGV